MKRDAVTVPMVNKLASWKTLSAWIRERQNLSNNISRPLVKAFKAKLGKQNYCSVLGSEKRKYWVWESDGWRVYVNEVSGFSLEVPEDSSKTDALKAWKSFYEQMYTHPGEE